MRGACNIHVDDICRTDLQCIYNQWPVGVRILNRSLFEVRHFVALRGKHVE